MKHSHLLGRGAVMVALLGLSGYGGGTNWPRPISHSASGSAAAIARWQPIVSADATIKAPPLADSSSERAEIARLLDLQNARTPDQIALFQQWNNQTVARWNQVARALVMAHDTPPPLASRVYAALSVAQLDATIAANRAQLLYQRAAPAQADARLHPLATGAGDYPSQSAAICRASADVLASLYPGDASIETQARQCEQARLVSGLSFPSDLDAGHRVGDQIAAKVLARLNADGAANADADMPKPSGAGIWPGTHGLLPSWGRVQPWLTADVSAFRAAPAPAFGSPEFNASLAEVRQISDTRTPEQLQIAEFWADAAQTFTPPGHWNLFATQIIGSHN